MSIDRDDTAIGARPGVDLLLAQAAAAQSRADARRRAVAAQLVISRDFWLTDADRVVVTAMLSAMVAGIGDTLRDVAHQSLTVAREAVAAGLIAAMRGTAPLAPGDFESLPALLAELAARVAERRIADALSVEPSATEQVGDPAPELLGRLATIAHPVVPSAARRYAIAEARRRGPDDLPSGTAYADSAMSDDLPAELYRPLVWHIAAALGEAARASGRERIAIDRALDEAAAAQIAVHDDTGGLEAAAMRLIAAVDARVDELPELAIEALRDRRLPLFIATVAHALSLDYRLVRDFVIDPADARLWTALRALDFPRDALAMVGVALCEADPRRDIDAFADSIDTLNAIDAGDARLVMAHLRRRLSESGR